MLSSLVRFSWEEAVVELEVIGRGSEVSLDLDLDRLLDLSLSVFIQLDSSCLDK